MKRSVVLSYLFLLLFSNLSPASAAEKGWRFWAYFQSSPTAHSWKMALTGPSVEVKDGAVEGWVFTLSSKSVQSKRPSVSPNFSTICSGVDKEVGIARVGLVVDFGPTVIAPKGEKPLTTLTRCVRVSEGSNGLDVLQQVVDVRQSGQGFICALAKYPARECSAQIVVPSQLKK